LASAGMCSPIANALAVFSDYNAPKLLLLVLSAAGLYAVARWASSLRGQGQSYTAGNQDGPESHKQTPIALDPQEVVASFPLDPELGKIQITKFFFKELDVIPGPPDPWTFADELTVEIYDPDSDHKWLQSYFVASPQGLSQILRDKSWKYLYTTEMLVLPKYDLEEIRRAVVSRIVETNEYFKSAGSKEESL
jgi:hypothetical protein